MCFEQWVAVDFWSFKLQIGFVRGGDLHRRIPGVLNPLWWEGK